MFEEEKSTLQLDLPVMNTDRCLQAWDSKKRKYIDAAWLKQGVLPSCNHAIAIVGPPGSGKSSVMISLITSQKKHSRVYSGCFDKVIICANETSIRSIQNDPFKSIPSDQIHDEFNSEFLDYFEDLVKTTSGKGEDVMCIIDDACSRLRSNKKLHDQFLNLLLVRRHLRFSVQLLCQDILQLSPAIRNALNGIILFRQINSTRMELIREEYLSMNVDNYRAFIKFVYQEPHDFLYICFKSNPPEFYRNFKKIKMK
jgi:ABC-type dipeptide/oligopeptide/nickel transport system ATPase component